MKTKKQQKREYHDEDVKIKKRYKRIPKQKINRYYDEQDEWFVYQINGRTPILSPDQNISSSVMVDPLVQALVLTSIVIGLATTALVVGVAIRIYDKYGTFDITKIRKLKG